MALKTTHQLGEPIKAVDMNSQSSAIIQNQHNILELFLENFFAAKITPFKGLFFDGFGDTTKADLSGGDITSPASSGQADVVVSNVDGLAAGMEVDIFDITGTLGSNFETKIIDSIASLTITFTTNLANSYTTAGEVNRTSVVFDTGENFIQQGFNLREGNYRSLKQLFQDGGEDVSAWITRTFAEVKKALDAAVSALDTEVKVLGDETALFAIGDTVDISNATNTTRERRVLTGVSFAAGQTTLSFATGLVNAYTTSDFVERVGILPFVSFVDEGDPESFTALTYIESIADFGAEEAEDEYLENFGSVRFDYILKIALDKNN